MNRNTGNRKFYQAAAVFLFCGMMGETVFAAQYESDEKYVVIDSGEDYIPVKEMIKDETEYIPIYSKDSSYTVKEGDCLWDIAKTCCGGGKFYEKIAAENNISANGLVFPGQTLKIPGEKLYIPRQPGRNGGMEYRDIFQFDFPITFYLGVTEIERQLDALFPNVWPDDSDTIILWNVAENNYNRNEFSGCWQEFTVNVEKRMKEVLGDMGDNIAFETYTLENGDDLYFYSFDMTDETGNVWTEAVGYRLCENLRAEFIGISPQKENYPITGMVRYMTADFTEMATEEVAEDFSLRRGNPQGYGYMGRDTWDYEGLHNAFAVGYRTITGEDWISPKELSDRIHISKEKDYEVEWESTVMEDAVRQYLGKEEGAIYASDLEDITNVCMYEGWWGEWIAFNDEEISCQCMDEEDRKAIMDMGNFVNLSILTMDIPNVECYDSIKNLTGLKQLFLRLDYDDMEQIQVEDVSFLGNLENLEELQMENAFNTITDWSVLSKCKKLQCVNLYTSQEKEDLILPENPGIIILHNVCR